MKKQVNKSKYTFSNYCYSERWMSYWHQLDEIIKSNPESVLEVGVGDSVIGSYLKNIGIRYISLDIAEDLKPDILGSVEKISLPDGSCDCVCAFEVLEHLPFDCFQNSLREMRRVTKKYVIISLPHWGRHFSVEFRMLGIGKISLQKKICLFAPKHEFNGQHYWEIGKRGYQERKIKDAITSAGFLIKDDYVAFGSPYHHFFVLEKK